MIDRRLRPLLDGVVIFLLACALIYPLFGLDYLENWGSIESTFISEARFLREHLPHPGWQPLWYCGTRFDYIYPPALPYGTALLSLALQVSPARAYHLYIAVLYALGIAGVYALGLAGSGSRGQAWLAAGFTALLSPTLILMRGFRMDSPDWVPQRLHALMTYGEGPHVSALALMDFALAAAILALREWKAWALALAAVLCAAVVANNFYGAVALAMFFPLLTWSVWLEERRADVLVRAAAIGALACGLCAFWLTPSYVRITTMNLRWVAMPSSAHSGMIGAACVLIFAGITWVAAKDRKGIAWPVFLWGGAVFTFLCVEGEYRFHWRVAGNGLRLAPEFDLAAILVAAWMVASAWKRPMLRSGVVVLLCLAAFPAWRYLTHAWTIFPRATPLQQRCEYVIPTWIASHLPHARALPSGSVRFWYDAWNDNAQLHGGSDQGLLNQMAMPANWEILHGANPKIAVQWLQALGADLVIVPGAASQEAYHDYSNPKKFDGVLEPLYSFQGVTVYRVPRRFPELARVVDRRAISSISPPRGGDDAGTLARYLDVVEHGAGAEVAMSRPGPDTINLNFQAESGQEILVQETFDPAWKAEAKGKSLQVRRDPLGFMLVDAPPGAGTIHMHFDTPLENRIGWVVTMATCFAIASLFVTSGLKARTAARRSEQP